MRPLPTVPILWDWAEFTLSRKDPAYVGRAKEVQIAQKAIEEGKCPAEALPELKPVMEVIKKSYPQVSKENLGVGSTIFAVKPGDSSAVNRLPPVRKYLEDGQMWQMNMQQRDIVRI